MWPERVFLTASNVTVIGTNTIGDKAVIGMGSVVTGE
jgi:acetyltransferase-like isoleucine patch superfamily enzyme